MKLPVIYFIAGIIVLLPVNAIAQRPEDPPLNPCTNVIPNERGHTSDRFEVSGQFRSCCLCNAGTYLAEFCSIDNISSTVCLPCPRDVFPLMYNDEVAHSLRSCKPDNIVCSEERDKIPGSLTTLSQCYCKYGTFNVSDTRCQAWSECPPHHGVIQLGTSFSDTQCQKCVLGFDSPNYSSTERCTKMLPQDVKVTKNPSLMVSSMKTHHQAFSPTNYTSHNNDVPNQTTFAPTPYTDQASPNSSPWLIIGPIFGFLALVIIVIVSYCFRAYRQVDHQVKYGSKISNVESSPTSSVRFQACSSEEEESPRVEVHGGPGSSVKQLLQARPPVERSRGSSSTPPADGLSNIDRIVLYFERQRDSHTFPLTDDDVKRFIRETNIPNEMATSLCRSSQGQPLMPAACFAVLIRWGGRHAHLTHQQVIAHFERRNFQTVVDDLRRCTAT